MSTQPRYEPMTPTEQEAHLAAQSARRLAACLRHGESVRIRLVDDDQDITLPASARRRLASDLL